MTICRLALLLAVIQIQTLALFPVAAAEPPPPVITELRASNTVRAIQFTLYPGATNYTILGATNLGQMLTPDTNFFPAYISQTNVATNASIVTTNVAFTWEWRRTNASAPAGLYKVAVTPMSSNALLSATILNRLTYGPTPDEIQRISSIGPDAYLAEQLAPWTLQEDAVTNTHASFPVIEAKFVWPTNIVVGTRSRYYTNIFFTTNGSTVTTNYVMGTNTLYGTNANLAELRAWHTMRAVGARRQLLEILLQFFENHFVTEWDKSRNWFAGKYDDSNLENALAAHMEHRENAYWRAALLNPQCTFYDLLKISAESPAMIIYLDTVSSRGDGTRIANENYARELMELFTMGVDNGYDQTDITALSRVWTGWTLELFDPANALNPFALKTTNQVSNVNTNFPADDYRNLDGVWSLWYRTSWHSLSNKTLFPNKYVPARFGAPWTTRSYLPNTNIGLYQLFVPARTGTNGFEEGKEVIKHLADLPFTQEYISIKLCRLFVHDGFPNPSVDPAAPEYAFYNYAAGNLSPEAELVKACMLTWETNSPRGQIWKVLDTIFKSDLFRTHAAAQQKIKTPLEFTVSAIRALRSSTNNNLAGSFTAWTDGAALATPLNRMGGMLLFDRDAPDGYPESGPPWISAGTLAERIRWVQSFCIAFGSSGHSGDAGASACDIVGLLKAKTPSSTWTNAASVADYFLGILYPGEGAGNLAFARQAAIEYLNDGSVDTSTTYRNTAFAGVPTTHASYDERVRGMVAMLMAQPRFQEQ